MANKTYEERWLKDHYARTYMSHVSGYLLKDGRFIDLIKKVDYDKNKPYVYREDHRCIGRVYNKNHNEDRYSYMVDFINRGNIRVMPETYMITMTQEPTMCQMESIKTIAAEAHRMQEKFTAEVWDEEGRNTVFYTHSISDLIRYWR